MSTKTTFKRVALVAVSALAGGVMSFISIPSANAATLTGLTVGTVPTARVGETVTVPITLNLSGAGTANETSVLAAKVASAPSTAGGQTANSILGTSATNSTGAPVLWLGTSASGVMATSSSTGQSKGYDLADNNAIVATVTTSTGAGAITTQGGAGVAASAITLVHTTASSVTGYLSIKPDVAGTYTVLVSATNGDGVTVPSLSYEAGVGYSALVTITTGGAPTQVTLTDIGGKTSISGTYGALLRVNLKDANGNAVGISGDEAINVTVSAGYIAKATVDAGTFDSVAPTSSTTARMTKADFVNGIGFVNVLPTSTTAVVVTATGTGTLAAISTTASVTAFTTSDITVTSFLGRDGTVVTTGWASSTAITSTGSAVIPNNATSSVIGLTFADVGDEDGTVEDADTMYGYVEVEDTGGKIAGAPAGSNDLYFDKGFSKSDSEETTDTYTTVTLTHSAITTGGYTFNPSGDTVGAITVTSDTRGTTSSTGSVTASPTPVRAAAAGSVTLRALVKDQFNSALVGSAVTITVAGRNGTRTSETLLTDALGYVSTTITDSGTSSVSDTVTFTHSGGKTGTATITWGTYTIGTITVTGGKTASDTYEGQNTTTIDTDAAGPDSSSVAITATVKDADGNLLSGVPVTFTVSKGLIRKTSSTDYTTVYTGSLGTATTYVLDWTEGKQTITATSGDKSASDYLTWSQTTAASARSISGTATGNKVTALVKDRFGNTVKGVTVTAKTSAGYFGSGVNSTTGTTDADGAVSFFVTGANGAATVTLSLDKDTYTQSIDVAGEVDETAVTAASATTTAGTGASFAAAGVNSVDVAITATDAAATAAEAATDAALEAIDAANAATDAANLAAEAADAATVAAEEARDAADAATAAVEALASEVATLIAGLKAQITTLANTVAKIAKKVKA